MLQKLRAGLVRQGPSLLSVPLKLTPFALKREILQQVLSWQFQEALADGSLDFLTGRWLRIEITDLDLQWFMTLNDGKLQVCGQGEADVSFCGSANDLILVAARREDPDTLFFKRRLHIEGDTELGLNVKNLMDAVELDSMPALLRQGLEHLAAFIEAGRTEVKIKEDGELLSPAVTLC